MKKIALASAAMGGAALLAFGASGTFAAFQDTEQGTASASAGTMDLAVGNGQVTGTIPSLGLNPGQKTTVSYWITNTGTTAGDLAADLTVTDEERGCQEPEKEAGDTTCDWATNGEFSRFATVQFLDAAADTPAKCATATTGEAVLGLPALGLGFAAGAADDIHVGSLAAGAGNCYVVAIELPRTATNVVQGDVSGIKVDVTLTQVTATRASVKIDGEVDPMPTPIEPIEFSNPGGPVGPA
jgi:predicted ribosomally synthesized peptide with SipW-like signal peptide